MAGRPVAGEFDQLPTLSLHRAVGDVFGPQQQEARDLEIVLKFGALPIVLDPHAYPVAVSQITDPHLPVRILWGGEA